MRRQSSVSSSTSRISMSPYATRRACRCATGIPWLLERKIQHELDAPVAGRTATTAATATRTAAEAAGDRVGLAKQGRSEIAERLAVVGMVQQLARVGRNG